MAFAIAFLRGWVNTPDLQSDTSTPVIYCPPCGRYVQEDTAKCVECQVIIHLKCTGVAHQCYASPSRAQAPPSLVLWPHTLSRSDPDVLTSAKLQIAAGYKGISLSSQQTGATGTMLQAEPLQGSPGLIPHSSTEREKEGGDDPTHPSISEPRVLPSWVRPAGLFTSAVPRLELAGLRKGIGLAPGIPFTGFPQLGVAVQQDSVSTYYTARTSFSPASARSIPRPFVNSTGRLLLNGIDALPDVPPSTWLTSLAEDVEQIAAEHPPELLNYHASVIQHAWRMWRQRQQRDPIPPPQAPISSLQTVNDISHSVRLLTVDPIACGGFCDLYLGMHTIRGKVALKRPRFAYGSPSDIRRFSREAALWCQISHPNILPFLGMCTIQSSIYMVSPFIKNGDLARCIGSGVLLDRQNILFQIACTICHLHNMGIVHGDIKAQNVLISDSGTPLLCDFGLSKAFDSMVTSTEVKGRGSIRWMAPELFLDANKTTSSDVFAFGMTVAEVLTGEPPFAYITANLAVLHAVVYKNERPPKEPLYGADGVSYIWMWGIAERCWGREAKDRPLIAEVVTMFQPADGLDKEFHLSLEFGD